MSEASNTPDVPREVVEEFERQLDEWANDFRWELARHFAAKSEEPEGK